MKTQIYWNQRMIKVGQIRKSKSGLCVISQYENDVAMIIFQDGYAMQMSKNMLEYLTQFIAEYPTWQEAIISPEFNIKDEVK